jgi:hypothetical protein
LSSTAIREFNQSALRAQLDEFELGWQNGTWGEQEGEEWTITGNLGAILSDIRTKWGDIL